MTALASEPRADLGQAGLERAEFEQVYVRFASLEFPWDTLQALSFALFRTYAVPSIGGLLYRTGEFTERTQKRYDDTNLLLDEVGFSGFESENGRAAIRRINQMHRSYDISNDDMRYVLSTFVVMPVRWLAEYGWRRATYEEVQAAVAYYRTLGKYMGIQDIPTDYWGFSQLMDSYEREHFAFDPGARKVADATLDLLATFRPYRWVPRPIVRRLSYALMDDHLLEAFRYPRPLAVERFVARSGIRLRSRFVRFLPPRREATRAVDASTQRTYPNGCEVSQLGTFPTGCPVGADKA